jgi:hypothetical protein
MTPVHFILAANKIATPSTADIGRPFWTRSDTDRKATIGDAVDRFAKAIVIDGSAAPPLVESFTEAHPDGGEWNAAFPACFPPFPLCAVTYPMPVPIGPLGGHVVVQCRTYDRSAVNKHLEGQYRSLEQRHPTPEVMAAIEKNRQELRTAYDVTLGAFTVQGHRVTWTDALFSISFAADGSIRKVNDIGHGVFGSPVNGGWFRDGQKGQWLAFATVIAPVLMTFSLMNCRNVTVRDNSDERNPLPQTLRKMRVPRLEFRKLIVRAVAPSPRECSKAGDDRDAVPLHICRGHFAHYTEDKPLFGRPGMHGRFFVPQHVRGKAENGIVLKDYEVKPR